MERPNVLLIVLDTARADAFEQYGAPAGSTPSIAHLSTMGRAHPATYAPACWTVPSHVSMFSGLLPRTAGITDVRGATAPVFRAIMQTQQPRLLPEVLRANGYRTAGLSANSWIHSASGFDFGFDDFRYFPTTRAHAIGSDDLKARARWYLQALRARADDGATGIEMLLNRWVVDEHRQPFFWFVNLMECHSPYLPPKPYTRLGAIDRLRCAREAREHLNLISIWMQSVGGFRVPEGALARMRSQYAAAILQMDAWVGRVLELLDVNGVLDETIVIVTADHGENFGEGQLLGHAFSLDERLIRVPFVYAGPLRAAELESQLMSLTALPRVLATALELESHPWTEPAELADVVVAQLDPPAARDDPRLQPVLDEWKLGPDALDRFATGFTCASDGRVKLLRRDDGEHLVVLADDPLELRPLPVDDSVNAAHGATLVRLRAALDDAATREHAPPRPEAADLEPNEVEQLEAQMRQLGYL